MCSFLMTELDVSPEQLARANACIRSRGPDSTKTYEDQHGRLWIHNLLNITGPATPQPFVSGDDIAMFNGEVYNFKELLPGAQSDGEVLLPLLDELGDEDPSWLLEKMDMEAAGVIWQQSKRRYIIFTDPFATKPVWWGTKDMKLSVATYRSALLELGLEAVHIHKVEPGTAIALRRGAWGAWSFKYYQRRPFYAGQQVVDSYEPWIEAWQRSIAKRTKDLTQGCFLGLSAGYDSGAISCELSNQGVDSLSISIAAKENPEVLAMRMRQHYGSSELIHLSKKDFDRHLKLIKSRCEPHQYQIRTPHNDGMKSYPLHEDKGAIGISVVCERAKERGHKIYLSGQGSDEILSDYGRNGKRIYSHSTLMGTFPDDLAAVFPWSNFFEGTQAAYIAKEDHVAGMHGLEGRYPFLDTRLVQAFLNLTPELKNKLYKAPLHAYLAQEQYPFTPDEKTGFSCNHNLR